MVYRANRNLTKMTDLSLNTLVIVCVARGIDFDEIEKLAGTSYVVGRKAVKYAAAALDLFAQKLVVNHEMPDIEVLLFKQIHRLLVNN